jgi:hypothetical protein
MATPEYIEKAVAATLMADADVVALVGVDEEDKAKVYPLIIPQGTKLPAIVYQRIYSSPWYTLRGYTSEDVLLQINCFALSFQGAKETALAVRSAMAGTPLNAVLRNEIDLHEEGAEAYCVSAEYQVQQKGGFCHG